MSFVLFAVLVTTMSYTIYSLISWRNYERTYLGWSQSVKTKMDAALALPSTSVDEKKTKLRELGRVDSEITKQSRDLCSTWFLSGWQGSIVRRVRVSEEHCRDVKEQIEPVIGKYSRVVAYLEDQATLSDLLAAAQLQSNPDGQKSLQANADAWKLLRTRLDSFDVNDQLRVTKDIVAKKVTAIDAGWQEVMVADKAQDTKRLLKATAGLSAAYDELNIDFSQDKKSFQTLLDEFDRTYRTILAQ